MITHPMLAGKVTDTAALAYPVIASPKLDGIRCLKLGGAILSRSLKPIPNAHIRDRLAAVLPNGVDGEIIVGQTFQDVSSGVMSRTGAPAFTYHAFDFVTTCLTTPYDVRLIDLNLWFDRHRAAMAAQCVQVVPTTVIADEAALLAYEAEMLAAGHEGVMVRAPRGPYKCGRSTTREGWLLKLKRFVDAEARIIGFVEQMHNANAQTTNELGRAKRSHCQAGMVPAGTLGAFKVQDVMTGAEFELGTGLGLTQDLRQAIWNDRDKYQGRLVKYRSQPFGVKDKPRIPVWLGFRDPRDM